MYTLYGALASPYSMKIRSLLRYRRLPFVWRDGAATQEALRQVRAPVIPVLEYPDGSFANDSTPLLYDLEQRHEARGVVPPDPAIAFAAHLLEDFADEWMTKPMFGYRWLEEVDQVQMSRWLAFDNLHGGGLKTSQSWAEQFRARQVGRMPMVGCTRENFGLIEASARAVLDILERRVTSAFFLFGTRPSLAEFGLYGQISQLATDPTPQAMMRAEFPYTYRWCAHMDDLSGVEGEWADEPSDAALELLGVAGEVYAPFLAANAAALAAGAEELEMEAMGHRYRQAPFKYQAKCLADLRARYTGLADGDRARVDAWIGSAWTDLLSPR
ncbi:glutathione S-transferase [Altererythrobacter arenosus]|uniref:Glutathione S-transferase n=1 Tax=Altererythrobacter arenosus TaxID=3032592 RepID=A0ABY8FMH5_9SPHN|nr:glutathione S-transferase [Altererythrobacter sp. CAU 1644]WFL76229.1 glutathione S-transferase [Altererythrobacter sp. CAU 1644]